MYNQAIGGQAHQSKKEVITKNILGKNKTKISGHCSQKKNTIAFCRANLTAAHPCKKPDKSTHTEKNAARFIKAHPSAHEKPVYLNHLSNWNKERGARKKPIPGVTIEEGPHPFGILAKLKPTLPSRIHAVERRGEVIISPEKWADYPNRKEITELGACKFQDQDYVRAEISIASTVTLVYRDGAIATVQNDFEDPYKQRTVHIVGELPDGTRFQRSVAIRLDLTYVRPKDEEHAPYVKNGIRIVRGCTDAGSGMGRVIMDEEITCDDEQGAQMKAFLEYVRTGKKPEGLMNFRDESRAEKIMEAVLRSIKADRELRYAEQDYV